MTVGGISDIDIVNPQNGQALIWNDVSQKWVNVDEGIHDLADAHITNPAEGQVFTYDNTSAKWVNKNITLPYICSVKWCYFS